MKISFEEMFTKLASKASTWMGRPWAFLIALLMVVIWGASGPIFHYSDTWELIINTATTIITFLMVFLIQNTQNRDAQAIHLKLDELILAEKLANNAMIDAENMSSEKLQELAKHYQTLCQTASQLSKEKNKDKSKSSSMP